MVIGAGAGGLVTAGGSGGLGAKVALIERHYMGGDCLVSGCVPSKAFIKAANEIYKVKTGRELIYSFSAGIWTHSHRRSESRFR